MDYNGERFLDILYQGLYKSEEVLHTKEKNDTKEQSIKRYMDRLEHIHSKANTESKKELVKSLYFDKYVIKEENLPDDIGMTAKRDIIKSQKRTLSMWIDYLTDENAKYPMWAKYWVFQQMIKMGTYDEVSGKYTKRNNKTKNPFVEANPEVIAKCIGSLTTLFDNDKLSSQQIRNIVGNISFEKMYIEYQKNYKEQYKSSEGIWIKYNQGNMNEAYKLSESLQGYYTKWCTTEIHTAQNQIKTGDFYVYYTKNEKDEYKIPRIALRLYGNKNIAEVRGVDGFQDLEEEMVPVLESKLKEMKFLSKKDVKKYLEKIKDLQELKEIKEKIKQKKDLSISDIYNLYTKKYGFGFEQDYFVQKLIEKRDILDDYELLKQFDISKKVNFILSNSELIREYNVDGNNFEVKEKDVMFELIKTNPYLIMHASDELKNDSELLLEVLSKNQSAFYKFVGSELLDNANFMLKVTRIWWSFINLASKRLKSDRKFMLNAIKEKEETFFHADSSLKNDKDFILKAIKLNPKVLRIIDKDYKKNREIVNYAISEDESVIKYADYDLRTNKKYILRKIKTYPRLFRYLPPILAKNKKFVLSGIKKNPYAGLYYIIGRIESIKNK